MREPDHERTTTAWRHYVETGELDAARLRPHIHRAWTRCHMHGTSPRTLEPRVLSAEELAKAFARERALLEAARPYLLALSRAAGHEHHAAMLADRQAVLLDVIGDAEHVHAPGFPPIGSLLSEEHAGANGIGSPLAEGAYFELVGPEHFIEGFHLYTCQGVPIHGPEQEVVGALSISVQRLEAAERVHEILLCATYGIEAELMRQRLEDDVAHVLAGGEDRSLPLDQLRQDVTQLQSAARLRLERAARVTGESTSVEATRLTLAANQLAARFKRQSTLWRELAFESFGAPQPIDVRARTVELAELLHTEASLHELQITVEPGPSVVLSVDSRALSREIFRAFLRAFGAEGGGPRELVVHVEAPQAGGAVLRFTRGGRLVHRIALGALAPLGGGA